MQIQEMMAGLILFLHSLKNTALMGETWVMGDILVFIFRNQMCYIKPFSCPITNNCLMYLLLKLK